MVGSYCSSVVSNGAQASDVAGHAGHTKGSHSAEALFARAEPCNLNDAEAIWAADLTCTLSVSPFRRRREVSDVIDGWTGDKVDGEEG